jgi:RsiW-degrading membrane proteinase PrsW (M82 family)
LPAAAASRSQAPSSAAADDEFDYKLAPLDARPSMAAALPSAALSDSTTLVALEGLGPQPLPGTVRLASNPATVLAKEAVQLERGLTRRSARRFLYLLFPLTLLPLVLFTFHNDNTIERIERTIASHPELEQTEIGSEAALFQMLPNQRFEGAHLGYFSNAHWAYGLLAAVAFLALILVCFELGRAKAWQLAIVALVTATVGILFLIVVQWIAEFTQGRLLVSRNIFVLVFFYLAKFIGFSYTAALDPEYGFWMSFFGFTFGVGLCEELTKALPILIMARSDGELDWRGAAIWGLASGIGFGVAEGILYSADYYNGVHTGEIYIVRFVSCAALHAMWASAVGIMIARCRDEMQRDWEWGDLAIAILKVQGVPMVLHGLYDVLLKKELNV